MSMDLGGLRCMLNFFNAVDLFILIHSTERAGRYERPLTEVGLLLFFILNLTI